MACNLRECNGDEAGPDVIMAATTATAATPTCMRPHGTPRQQLLHTTMSA